MHHDEATAARNALDAISETLWWLEQQEWMIQEWQMETNPEFFTDRRYIAARERQQAYRDAARVTHTATMASYHR